MVAVSIISPFLWPVWMLLAKYGPKMAVCKSPVVRQKSSFGPRVPDSRGTVPGRRTTQMRRDDDNPIERRGRASEAGRLKAFVEAANGQHRAAAPLPPLRRLTNQRVRQRCKWRSRARFDLWAILDSNQGPLPYQRSALTG